MGLILGLINSRLILIVVHLIVLQPIAFFMRFLKYDPLRLKKNKKDITYREIKKHSKFDLTKIF